MSWTTLVELVRHFARANRWFLIPFLLVLMALGLLLLASQGLATVAPFVYAIF